MEISRYGYARDHGTRHTTATITEGTWRKDLRTVHLLASNVGDFNTEGRHTWNFNVSPGEIGHMVEILAGALKDGHSEVIGKAMAASLQSLLVLAQAGVEQTRREAGGA